jgi:hypothetical protein
MSMHKTDRFLRPCHLAQHLAQQGKQHIYVFVYDHHYFSPEFQASFPTGRLVGLGFLPNWTWHVNHQGMSDPLAPYLKLKLTSSPGKPNIRRASHGPPDHETETYVLPTPATARSLPSAPILGTYGYVFQVPLTQTNVAQIHGVLGHNRIRAGFYVNVLIGQNPPRIVQTAVITYWDPRNTATARRCHLIDPRERAMWMRGKVQLIAAGVPPWYLTKVFRHLYGLMEDVEPLFVSPRDLLAPRSPPRVVDRVEVVDDDTEAEGEEGPNGQPAGTTVLSSVGAAGVVSRKRARNPYCDQEHRQEQRQAQRQR